uniref:Uncharacterized protein n=1 Tax=Caenorhabditis japonica TaxID=281687 RepID=A0A8R1ETL8_CAEJA
MELSWGTVPHPPYSPGIAPSDYHLLRPVKLFLKKKRFAKYEDLKMTPKERSSGNRPEWRRMQGDTKSVQKKNHTSFVKTYLSNHCTILGKILSTRKIIGKSGKPPSGELHQVQRRCGESEAFPEMLHCQGATNVKTMEGPGGRSYSPWVGCYAIRSGWKRRSVTEN